MPVLATLVVLVAFAVVAVVVMRNRVEQNRTATQVNPSDQTGGVSTGHAAPDLATPATAGSPKESAVGSPPPTLSMVTARIDLRQYSALGAIQRDAATTSQSSKSIRIATARTHLVLRLQEGSSSGLYAVSILDRATLQPLISAKENSATGKNLDVTFNLEVLAPKEYVLRIERLGEAPSDYSLLVHRM